MLALVLFFCVIIYILFFAPPRPILAIGLTSVSLGISSSPALMAEEPKTEAYSMVLSADKTDFVTGDKAVAVLTVHTPDAEVVGIYNEAGECLATLTPENIDENGNLSVEIDVSAEEDTVLSLSAKSDNGSSMPLTIYVTAEITPDMLQNCLNILDELEAYLSQRGYEQDAYDNTVLEMAGQWLQKDPRIASVFVQETMTVFITNDHVTGALMLPLEEDTFGTDNETFQTDSAAATLYKDWNAGESLSGSYISSANASTNNNVLVLCPIYESEYNCVKSIENYEKILDKYGAEYTGGGSTDIKKGASSLDVIFSSDTQDVADNGMILYNSHGSYLTRDNGSKLWATMFYESSDVFYERMLSSEAERLGNKGKVKNSCFYGDETVNTVRLVMTNTGIWATSNFIMSKWEDTMFDNTFLYFGACYSACDDVLRSFLVSHGVVGVAGYLGSVNCDIERSRSKSVLSNFMSYASGSQSYKTIKESVEDSYGFFNNLQYRFTEGVYIAYNAITGDGNDAAQDSDQMLYVETDRRDFTLYGYGKLSGTVLPAESGTESNEEFSVAGAKVTAYRYINKSYIQKASLTLDESGNFSFDDLEYGVYAIVVEKDDFQTSVTGIIFENKSQNGGKIYLCHAGTSICGTIFDADTMLPIAGVTVTCNGTDSENIAETNENGKFLFEEMTGGNYTITAVMEGYFESEEYRVTLEDEMDYEILNEIYITPQAVISGIVKDEATGEAVIGASVRCKSGNIEVKVTTDGNGAFQIPKLWADTYEITVTKGGYAEENRTVVLEMGESLIADDIQLKGNVEASGSCGENVVWVLDTSGTLTISGEGKVHVRTYQWGASGDWEKYDKHILHLVVEKGITEIGPGAFARLSSLTDVELPDTLTKIANNAFEGCISLIEVSIPSGITEIESHTFHSCSKLEKVVLPERLEEISSYAFSGCISLKEIELPSTLYVIGFEAFYDCYSLGSIKLPDGVASINTKTFYKCKALKTIYIPASVTAIAKNAFEYCDLEAIYYAGSEEQWEQIHTSYNIKSSKVVVYNAIQEN